MENLLQLLLLGSFFTIQNPQAFQMENAISVERKNEDKTEANKNNEEMTWEELFRLSDEKEQKYMQLFDKKLKELLDSGNNKIEFGELSMDLGNDDFALFYGGEYLGSHKYGDFLRGDGMWFGDEYGLTTEKDYEEKYFKNFNIKDIVKDFFMVNKETDFTAICHSVWEGYACYIVDNKTGKHMGYFSHLRAINKQKDFYVVEYGHSSEGANLTLVGDGFNIELSNYREGIKLNAFSQDDNGIQITYKDENNVNKTKKISWEDMFPTDKE